MRRQRRLPARAALRTTVLAGLLGSASCAVSPAGSPDAGGQIVLPPLPDAGEKSFDARSLDASTERSVAEAAPPCWGQATFTGPLAFSADLAFGDGKIIGSPRLAFASEGQLVLAKGIVESTGTVVVVQKRRSDGSMVWEQQLREADVTLADLRLDASDGIWLLLSARPGATTTSTDSFRVVALTPEGATVMTRSVKGPANVQFHLAVSRDAVLVAGSNSAEKLSSFLMWFGFDGTLLSTHAFAANWNFDAVAMDDDRHVYLAAHADGGAFLSALDDTGAVLWQQGLGASSQIQSLEWRGPPAAGAGAGAGAEGQRLVLSGDFAGELVLGGTTKRAQSRRDLFFASLNTDASVRFIDTLAPNGLTVPSSLSSLRVLARDDGTGGLIAWGWTSDRIPENDAFATGTGFFLAHADAQGKWTASASFPVPWSLSAAGAESVYALAVDPQGRVAVAGSSTNSPDLGGPQREPITFVTLFQQSTASPASPAAPDRSACPGPAADGETVLAWSSDLSLSPQVKLHGDHAVWATDADFFEAPVSGGAIVRLAHGQGMIGVFAIAGDDLVWTRFIPASSSPSSSSSSSSSGGHSELLRLVQGAAMPVILADDLPKFVNGLAAVGDTLYWSGADDTLFENGRIGRVPAGASASESASKAASEITSVGSHPAVAADGGNLFWAMTTSSQDAPRMTQVFRGPPTSLASAGAPLAAFEGWVNDLAAEKDTVVWVQQEGAFSYIAREGGALVLVSAPSPQSLAFSNGEAFFVDKVHPLVWDALGRAIGKGTLFKVGKDHNSPTQVRDHVMSFAVSSQILALVRSDDDLRWALTAPSR